MLAGNDCAGIAAHVDNIELLIATENMAELLDVIGLLGEVNVVHFFHRRKYAELVIAVATAGEAGRHQFHQQCGAAAGATDYM